MKGKISITKFSSSTEPRRGIQIHVEDESSGVRVLEVILSSEQFGDAIGGYADCEFSLGRVDLVGKIRESKTERIPVPTDSAFGLKDKHIDKMLVEYEIDGWKGYRNDFKNHHRFNNDHTVSVNFVRYVEQK